MTAFRAARTALTAFFEAYSICCMQHDYACIGMRCLDGIGNALEIEKQKPW